MNKQIIDKRYCGVDDVYEIVNEFPPGYELWNIGRKNFQHEGYIPLVEFSERPYIKRDTLKALKVESEELALFLLKKAHKIKVNCLNFIDLVNEFKQND